jgi:hypothetical protein
MLERCVPTRTIPHKHNVIVGINDAGNHRSAAEIHRSRACRLCRQVVADRNEASVAYDHLRHNGVVRIHRVNASIREKNRRIVLRRLRRADSRRSNQGECRGTADELSARDCLVSHAPPPVAYVIMTKRGLSTEIRGRRND